MKKWLLALTLMCSWQLAQSGFAQDMDPDFARRIRPEAKVDLSKAGKQHTNPQASTPETAEDMSLRIKNYKEQREKTLSAIAALEAAGTPKEDNQYIKYQMTLKYLDANIETAGMKLAELSSK